MLVSEPASFFREFVTARGMDPETANIDELVNTATEFHETVPVSGLASMPKADMLLFQFGIYDWGSGEYFEFDITRQFIVDDKDDDDSISQLHCTVLYVPDDALRAVGSGDRWCGSRDELPAFKAFILSSKAYLVAMRLQPYHRRIIWSPV